MFSPANTRGVLSSVSSAQTEQSTSSAISSSAPATSSSATVSSAPVTSSSAQQIGWSSTETIAAIPSAFSPINKRLEELTKVSNCNELVKWRERVTRLEANAPPAPASSAPASSAPASSAPASSAPASSSSSSSLQHDVETVATAQEEEEEEIVELSPDSKRRIKQDVKRYARNFPNSRRFRHRMRDLREQMEQEEIRIRNRRGRDDDEEERVLH
jgi:hypothetical protein